MKRSWITDALHRQLKICRAVAAKPEELHEIAQLEDAIDSVNQPQVVNFATGPADKIEQEVGT